MPAYMLEMSGRRGRSSTFATGRRLPKQTWRGWAGTTSRSTFGVALAVDSGGGAMLPGLGLTIRP